MLQADLRGAWQLLLLQRFVEEYLKLPLIFNFINTDPFASGLFKVPPFLKLTNTRPFAPGFTTLHLRMLVYLVMHGSGQVSLDHLLLSRDPSQSPPLSTLRHCTFVSE